MKVLVTGGAGFIGSHLADRLCRAGDIRHCEDAIRALLDGQEAVDGGDAAREGPVARGLVR